MRPTLLTTEQKAINKKLSAIKWRNLHMEKARNDQKKYYEMNREPCRARMRAYYHRKKAESLEKNANINYENKSAYEELIKDNL
jgi:hypothetical protein